MPNTLTLTGRLGDDIQVQFAPSGDAVASGRIADTPRRKNQQTGEWEDGETLWLSFTLWGRKAEVLADTAKKGDLVMLTGTLTQRSFEGKHGEQRTVIEVKATEVAVVPRIQSGAGWSKDRTANADPWAQPNQPVDPSNPGQFESGVDR